MDDLEYPRTSHLLPVSTFRHLNGEKVQWQTCVSKSHDLQPESVQVRKIFYFINCVHGHSGLGWVLEGRKVMFYLMTHSTHFKRLYGIGRMIKDHSDSERGNCCCHMGYSFRLAEGFFYMHPTTDMTAHTKAYVTPEVEHWLERGIELTTHRIMSGRSDHGATSRSFAWVLSQDTDSFDCNETNITGSVGIRWHFGYGVSCYLIQLYTVWSNNLLFPCCLELIS